MISGHQRLNLKKKKKKKRIKLSLELYRIYFEWYRTDSQILTKIDGEKWISIFRVLLWYWVCVAIYNQLIFFSFSFALNCFALCTQWTILILELNILFQSAVLSCMVQVDICNMNRIFLQTITGKSIFH